MEVPRQMMISWYSETAREILCLKDSPSIEILE